MMTQLTTHVGRTARRLTIFAVPLLVAASGTAAAHAGGSYGGGMMDGGWGLFGGAMGILGLLWMMLLIAVPLAIVYMLLNTQSGDGDEESLSVLRTRYARGELSDDEFDRRRKQLKRTK